MQDKKTQQMKQPILDVYQALLDSGEIQPDEDQHHAAQILSRLAERLRKKKEDGKGWRLFKKKHDGPTGVYMYGGVGRGKSMLMDLFHRHLPDSVCARRVHFHEFMIDLHDYIHQKRQEHKKGGGHSPDTYVARFVTERCKNLDVLCFDEFHVTDVADAMLLGRMFEEFFRRSVSVVCTTNWMPDLLYRDGLQRERFVPVIEMIKEHMMIVPLDGDIDYRLRSLEENGVYFSPLGLAAERKIDALFEDMTDEQPVQPARIKVKGRVITVPQSTKNVARMSFHDLCEKPLGAEDYLALAGRYQILFLDGVPRLGYDRRNETKRLMTLVDALYDNGVKLIVTADAPVEKLYTGQDHAFEFQRTVSRLIEMCSAAYLQK